MQGLARRVNSLTQPFVHWYFFLLFLKVLASVVCVHRGARPQLANTATSRRPFVANFLDHGGFGDIVATFSSHAVPSRKVNGNTVQNGLTDRTWSRE